MKSLPLIFALAACTLSFVDSTHAARRRGKRAPRKQAPALQAPVAVPAAEVERTPAPPVVEQPYVAMTPLSSLGSTDEALVAMERILVQEVRALVGDDLVPPAELEAKAGERYAKDIRACDGEVTCLVEVVGAMGWRAVIAGNVAGLGENRAINLRYYDLRTGGPAQQVSEQASGDERVLITQMRKAAVQLLAPDKFVGTLVVTANQPSIQILLDGKLVGTTPLKDTEFQVPVGRHAVEAKGEGLVPFETMLNIKYGEKVPLIIELPSNQLYVGGRTPFYGRWWTWAIMGVGLAAAGTGAYFNVSYANRVQDFEANAASCDPASASNACNLNYRTNPGKALKQDKLLSQILYGAGGGLLGTAGVLFAIDLF